METPTYWTAPPAEWEPPASVRFTGVVLRSAAFFIDLVLLAIYWSALLFTPVGTLLNGPVLAALLFVVPFLYLALGWGRSGTTIGMRVLGLRIVRGRDGGPIGYGTAALRLGAFTVILVAGIGLVGLGLIALPMVLDRRRRGLHDRIAQTVVVRPARSIA